MRRVIDRFFFAPATATNLGVLRIGLFATAALWALQENVEGDARAAAVYWRPTSFFKALDGPPSAGALRAVQVALICSALFAAVGLFTRASQLVATPLAVFLFGFDSNFGKINHRSILLVLILLALLPARVGDGVSLDRLIAAARTGRAEPPGPAPSYRWPVALAQTTVVSVYLFAGLSKILNGGLGWFSAESFQRFIYARVDQLADPPAAGLWLASHPALAQATAIASVAFELSMVLIVVRPIFRRLAVPGLIAFHEATRIFTRIDFRRTLCVAILPLIDYEAVGRRLRARVTRPRLTVLLDSSCALCRRTGSVVRAADALDRIDLANARDPLAWARFGVSESDALTEMHVVLPGGRTRSGFEAFRALAASLPVAWPLLPLLWLPGVRSIGRVVYGRVARSRFPVFHCPGASCNRDEVAEVRVRTEARL